MTESQFNDLVDATLLSVEEAMDGLDDDIDYENVGGILTLTFSNGSKIIINRQTPARQIWVAAKSGGFHFDYRSESDSWHRDDDGAELFAALETLCTTQAGHAIQLL